MENNPSLPEEIENTPLESFQKEPPSYSGAALQWLQAFPGGADLSDPFTLDENDFAIRCIRELTGNRAFELPLKAQHQSNKALHHFYFESRNREKVFGTRNLGIGYPFILAQIGDYEVCAPLFIRQVQLEPHAQHTDNWQVIHTEQHLIFPNYPFFHLVDYLHHTDFSTKARELSEKKRLDGAALSAFCAQLLQQLGLEEDGLPLSVQPFPDQNELPELMRAGRLCWSALIGIYPTLPKTTITHPPVVAPNLPADMEWRHNFTQLVLDGSQREALLAAHHNALSVIEGASGTGKTYLLSAIAINALSNGKKCLIVSKSLAALRRAQKFIVEKGFGDVSFVLRDIYSDHLMLTDMLRMAADNKQKAGFDDEQYKSVLNRAVREERKLDEAWEAMHTPIFGELDFSDTVGLYLNASRLEGKEMLLSQLQPADFAFTREEYDNISTGIRHSYPLFQRFPTLEHPLNTLNSDLFRLHDAVTGLAHSRTLADTLLEKSTGLHHRFIVKTNDYTEALTEHYEQYFSELDAQVKGIRDSVEDGLHRFGPDFEKPLSVTEKLYGVFSDHYKMVTAAKEKISADFDAFRKYYLTRKYFDFDFPANLDTRNIKKIAEVTRDFEANLRVWRKKIPSVVREDVRRLNNMSIHPELDFREQVKELEYAMDLFMEEFNEAGLYEAHLKHEMLTIPKRQEFLEEIIEKLETTRFYLRDFEDFHVWQRHWLGLNANQQKVVRALCKIKPRNWTAAFDSWYLFHFLQNEYQPGMRWPDDGLEAYNDALNALRNLMPAQISALWQSKKNKALRALKSTDSNAYKTWFGKNNRSLSTDQSIDDLFANHILPLTETLPVLLVTPQVALDVVNLSNMLFDLVLVDEAHNIPKQEGYHLFDMAKNIVVFGDAKQDMTPQAEDDLLEYCKSLGAPTKMLEFQHQDSPDEWLRFNQIAFNTPAHRLPAPHLAKDMTVVENVGGRYDERARTNEAEARQIIDWLNLIEPTPAKTYPVVGIACATVEQRNLIASQLLQIRQKKLPGFEKIHQLYLNGLGVYQFAELQGQHLDVLMLSITHGLVDAQGGLTRDLHFWNTQLGLNQLHVTLTRASQRIFIAHSIPAGLHSVLAADKNFLGTCILSHLATFAEQLQQGDTAGSEQQLEKMKQLLQYQEYPYPLTPFMKEVAHALEPYCPADDMLNNSIVGGIQTPMAIRRDDGEAPLVLLFDGLLNPRRKPSFDWELKLQRYLHKHNIQYASVFAAQWWKNPRQEVRKLANLLIVPEVPVVVAPETDEPAGEQA